MQFVYFPGRCILLKDTSKLILIQPFKETKGTYRGGMSGKKAMTSNDLQENYKHF